jgi:hypothetical protein
MALGVVRPPHRAKQIFLKKLIWPLGVANPHPRAMGWLQPPQIGQMGEADATSWPLGVADPPPTAKSNFFFFLKKKRKFVLPIGVGQTIPRATVWPDRLDGGGSTPPSSMALGSGSVTPKGQINFFKKICLALRGGRTIPKGHLKNNQKKNIIFFIFLNIKNIILLYFFIFLINKTCGIFMIVGYL